MARSTNGNKRLIPGLIPSEARRVLCRRHKISLQDLATQHGVHKSTLSKVLAGITRSRRIERLLAERMGLSVAEFFPEHSRKNNHGK